jgi:citrate synthase
MGTTIAGAGLEGVIARESEICYIDGYQGILSYRGFNIHTLADNAIFEEVIFLLWNADGAYVPHYGMYAAFKDRIMIECYVVTAYMPDCATRRTDDMLTTPTFR